MAGFSMVWNIVLSPSLLNEKLSTYDLRGTAVILVGCVLVDVSGSHDTPTHRDCLKSVYLLNTMFSLFFLLWRLSWIYTVIDELMHWYTRSSSSVALVAEGGSIWYRPDTCFIFVAALSSAGGGIYVLYQGLREHDALYLVAIYQEFLIIIGSVSGQLVVYPSSIVTTVGGIIVLSEKHNEHCDPGILSARIIVAKQGEISPLIISQNDRVKHGVKRGFVDIV
ncbi:hypothetical protein PsorP6_010473 [Peronosclerospora sorghi]|uniref:Uncharacterized protein n=1 Tax=Peronosclerospora sorghi TaxID=230839 RepID=A0ACC0VXZ3_9STRA|nr:hypothetical protein PsorP6_010473 [Peronosclerospora sorghi]